MYDKIWSYISKRYENDGVLVDADEIYTAFQLDFDTGSDVWMIDEIMEDFVSCSDLSVIQINWEGELHRVPSIRGIAKEFEVSPPAA